MVAGVVPLIAMFAAQVALVRQFNPDRLWQRCRVTRYFLHVPLGFHRIPDGTFQYLQILWGMFNL
ncbi:hypothetical protein D3C75_1149630 [compost metagenome]